MGRDLHDIHEMHTLRKLSVLAMDFTNYFALLKYRLTFIFHEILEEILQ